MMLISERRGEGARAVSPRQGHNAPPTAALKPHQRSSGRRRRIGIAFTAPSLAFVGIVMAYPLFYLIYLSFHTYRPLRSPDVTPAGLTNFISLFTDSVFGNSLKVTLVFTVASVIIEVIGGTACAILLTNSMLGAQGPAGRLFARLIGTAYIIPFAVPAVAGAFAWRMMLDYKFGPVNAVLGTSIPWLVEHPMVSIIIIDAWKMMPFVLFIMLAAVMSIDPSQYEAATLDGAGSLRQLFAITLPSILPVMAITAAFRAVDAFTKVFDTVFVTTGGGPGDDTRVLPLLIWRTAFDHLDFGAASAQAVAALVISLVFGAVLFFSRRRDV